MLRKSLFDLGLSLDAVLYTVHNIRNQNKDGNDYQKNDLKGVYEAGRILLLDSLSFIREVGHKCGDSVVLKETCELLENQMI
jgi:hypothetical protein